MKKAVSKNYQILSEQRSISKCAGLLCGRIFLLCLLLPVILTAKPEITYFLAFLFIVPWLLTNILEAKSKNTSVFLQSAAKKFFYTKARYITEQHIGRCIILFLAIWQIIIRPDTEHILITFVPGILLLLYLLCRIFVTIYVRHQIHTYYCELADLEG